MLSMPYTLGAITSILMCFLLEILHFKMTVLIFSHVT